MIWYLFLGCFCAFGILSACWVAFGWIFSRRRGIIICAGPDGRDTAVLCLWLKELGLYRGKILLIPEGNNLQNCLEHVEICSLDQLKARLELERIQIG